MFLIFINNMDTMAHLITIISKFADNTKLGQVIRSQANSEQLQSCLDRMAKWADMSAIAFNMSKCKVMPIGAQNSAYEYIMGGTRLGTRRR
jgi:hypothetical protein